MRSDSSEIVLEAWLSLGKRAQQDNSLNPEKVYLQALRWSNRIFGEESPQSGRILIALLDVYDEQGRADESKAAWESIREVLRKMFEVAS